MQAYVRPTEHPQLDSFCIELTGIQQYQVDTAEPLQAVLQRHHEWLQEQGMFKPGIQFVPVTWTAWDFQVRVMHPASANIVKMLADLRIQAHLSPTPT